MSLQSELKGWDGKSADNLKTIYDRYSNQTDFLDLLILWMNEPSLQSASSWLLKHHFDCHGGKLASTLTTQLYKNLSRLEHWDCKLHVLQVMPYAPIPTRQIARVKAFLDQCLRDENKFVRAWAYSGFWELARHHSRFRDEVETLLRNGLEQETAASIKARIRKSLNRSF